MRPSYIKDIENHARAEFPKEACGVLVKSDTSSQIIAIPLRNEARFPELYFQIPTEDYLRYKLSGNLLAIYHSHPRGTKELSEADLKCSEELVVPSLVYSLSQDDYSYYEPKNYITPLEGRMFVPLVFDCVSLVHDYFKQKYSLNYPMFPRKLEHINEGMDITESYCRNNGFSRIDKPVPNCVIGMTLLGGKFPNHLGVYLEKGIMLHQLVSRVSCREVYGGYWEKHTTVILVPPEFKPKI